MISLYLQQTPPLIETMKQSLHNEDWNTLKASVHKMIPSFSIMGIGKDFEEMAKKIQEHSGNAQHTTEIREMVLQLENVCTQACRELEIEMRSIEKVISG
jgi:HPt (histidine-containing phosphotransfer) domain-containing protein